MYIFKNLLICFWGHSMKSLPPFWDLITLPVWCTSNTYTFYPVCGSRLNFLLSLNYFYYMLIKDFKPIQNINYRTNQIENWFIFQKTTSPTRGQDLIPLTMIQVILSVLQRQCVNGMLKTQLKRAVLIMMIVTLNCRMYQTA